MLAKTVAEYEGKEIANLVADGDTGHTVDESIPLFVDYMRSWLADKKNAIELNTWESYETYVTKHVIPYFEKTSLTIQEVAPKHIKSYYAYKLEKGRSDKKGGLSVSSLKKHASVMNQAFNEALIEEIIDRNPMDKVKLPKHEQQEQKPKVFLTANEANE